MAQSTNITSSTQVHTNRAVVYAVIVNSHSSGTLQWFDDPQGVVGAKGAAFSYPSGSSVIQYGPNGMEFYQGCFAKLTNAQDITILWQRLN